MADKNQEAVIEQLMALDKRTLATRAAKQLGRYQKEIVRKDKLIADLTAQKSKAQIEADGIINDARQNARAMSEEARVAKADAERRLQEASYEADRKVNNAQAEADSIVETRLRQARVDIEKLEGRRDEAKRAAIALNRNIIEEYDNIADKIAAQISGIKDMQTRLRELSATIESEDFKRFDINDYVSSSTVAATTASKSSFIFGDDEEDLLAETDIRKFSGIDDDDDDYAPVVHAKKSAPVVEEDDLDDFDFDDMDDLDFDDDLDDDMDDDISAADLSDFADELDDEDTFTSGRPKSFTDAFMAIAPTMDDDDIDDFDFDDDILDDDDDDTPLVVPQKPNRSQRKGGPARWL